MKRFVVKLPPPRQVLNGFRPFASSTRKDCFLAAVFVAIHEHQHRSGIISNASSPWDHFYGFRVNGARKARVVTLEGKNGQVLCEVDLRTPTYERNRLNSLQEGLAVYHAQVRDSDHFDNVQAYLDRPNSVLHYRWEDSKVAQQTKVHFKLGTQQFPLLAAQKEVVLGEGIDVRSLQVISPFTLNYWDVQRKTELENPLHLTCDPKLSSPRPDSVMEGLGIIRPGKTLLGLVFADDSDIAGDVVEVNATMNGNVVDVHVQQGSKVRKGDSVVVLEAMKMESVLRASVTGTVRQVRIRPGDAVMHHQVLLTILPQEDDVGQSK